MCINKYKITIVIFLSIIFLTDVQSNADIHIENNTGSGLDFGILWTSIRDNKNGYINSYQWYGALNFKNIPITGTECFWIAIKKLPPGKRFKEYKNMGGNLNFYTTTVSLPINNDEIRINNHSVAGLNGIGSTAFSGRMDRLIEIMSEQGYTVGSYHCIKMWVPYGKKYNTLHLNFFYGVDGKINFEYHFY